MTTLFRLLSHWPLWALHGLGWVLGWLTYLASAGYRQRFAENAGLAGVHGSQLRHAVSAAGQQIAELPRLWMGRPVHVEWDGAEHVEAALEEGRGIVFLTPHMGCFEITAQAYAQRYGGRCKPITVLFRPPRKAWLRDVVAQSRQREGLLTAPTTLQGVKQLLRAVRDGECVGLLPDQVPGEGQGVWAPFFGRSAYTMTLPARLAAHRQARVLIAWGERLSWGRGYVVHVEPLHGALPTDPVAAAATVNQAMEMLVRRRPDQYLWGYARYKQPSQGLGT